MNDSSPSTCRQVEAGTMPKPTTFRASWLNQAEMEVSLLSRQCLGKRRIGDIAGLRQQTRIWNRRMNRDRVTIQWKFTRKQARHKFRYIIKRSKH